jgi:TonB family protein
MAWGTALAVALHAAVLLYGPAWRPISAALSRLSKPEEVRLTALQDPPTGLGAGAGGERAQASLPAPVFAKEGGGGGSSDGSLPGGTSPSLTELWNRVVGSGGIVPTVVPPGPSAAPAVRASAPDSADDVDIRGRASSTAGLAVVPELGEMDLGRLSAVRPELALMDHAAWALVRNPVEIDEFMRGVYDLGELKPGEEGLVGIALWVDELGTVQWAEVDKSSGRSDMDEVALELFKEVALFRPARDHGAAVPQAAVFWVQFPWTGTPWAIRSPLP